MFMVSCYMEDDTPYAEEYKSIAYFFTNEEDANAKLIDLNESPSNDFLLNYQLVKVPNGSCLDIKIYGHSEIYFSDPEENDLGL